MYGRVLIVASHPDDDILGCGAVMSALSNQLEIKAIYLSNGVGSREGTQEGEVTARLDAMERANGIIGYSSWEVGLFEDQRFDQYPLIELAKWVEMFVKDFKPETILTHTKADVNQDHRLTHDAVMIAARPLPTSNIKYIYTFEIPGSTDWGDGRFKPNVYLGGDFGKKGKALEEYSMELREWPHPRNVAGMWNLAMKRGSECGRPAAEAFELVRMVI